MWVLCTINYSSLGQILKTYFIIYSLFSAEITGNALLKGKFVELNGEKYVQFTSIDVDVDVKDYSVQVEKLFPDKNLSKLFHKNSILPRILINF